METYKNYINLNTFDKKVIMLMIDKVKENDNFVFKNLTTDFFENIWNYLSSKKDIDIAETFDTSVPVLYYGGNNKHAIKFLEKSNISKKNMYNKPSEMLITGDKKEFHKLFKSYKFMPKTVFTKEEVLTSLKFPIIAKPSDGHSGIGIVKFENVENFKKSKDTFDLYSEFIEHKQEFRVSMLKNSVVIVDERISKIGEKSTVEQKDKDDELKFVYVNQDLQKVTWMNEVLHISKIIHNILPLDVWSLDIVVTNDNEIFVLEANSASGLGAIKSATYYLHIYEDFYDEILPLWYVKKLQNDYIKPFMREVWNQNPEEVKKSPWRIDYKNI
jgi:glutathione synthase/RimK-type ligase-like ATP-grasp enzyme